MQAMEDHVGFVRCTTQLRRHVKAMIISECRTQPVRLGLVLQVCRARIGKTAKESSYVPSQNDWVLLGPRHYQGVRPWRRLDRRLTEVENAVVTIIIIIVRILVTSIPRCGTAGAVITPLAVPACTPKVPDYRPTLQEGTEAAIPTSGTAGVPDRPSTLDQDCIHVRGPMRGYLSSRDAAPYELDITPWKGKHRPLRTCVSEAGHLLIPHKEDRVLSCLGSGEGGVVQNKSPMSDERGKGIVRSELTLLLSSSVNFSQ